MSTQPHSILGLCYSHDASAALLQDGKPLVAIQKERLTRLKHDGEGDGTSLADCIGYCLSTAGITADDVAMVVVNGASDEPQCLFPSAAIHVLSDHLAHAYCAYGCSPFDSCAVLVIDGQGSLLQDLPEGPPRYERESGYLFSPSGTKALFKQTGASNDTAGDIHGLGHLYESFAQLVFGSRFDAGKLMGLAPYGKPLSLPCQISNIQAWLAMIPSAPANATIETHFQFCADLAATAQQTLETGVLSLAQKLRAQTKETCLAYAGGVALNCSANNMLARQSGFKELFIAPAATDCGIALGCAFYGHLYVGKHPKQAFLYHDNLGKQYSNDHIARALSKAQGLSFEKASDVAGRAAEALANNKIIGWFQGGSEFGPRALGHRSILAPPHNENTRDIINTKIKQREMFRPLAPAVLEERSLELFGISYSPYMLFTASVSLHWQERLAGVTHVDGSARVQTVSATSNPLFYDLISAYNDKTGIPVVLNTSFNGPNEPIVETPEDAIASFLRLGLDELYIGDFIVKKVSSNEG